MRADIRGTSPPFGFATIGVREVHLLYDLAKDFLGWASPPRLPECVCHCAAGGLVHAAECGPLERLLETQLEREGRAENGGLDVRVTLSLGLIFLVLGFFLGLIAGRRWQSAPQVAPPRAEGDGSPWQEGTVARLSRVRGRGVVIRA